MFSSFQKFQVKMTVMNKRNKQDALAGKTRKISPFQTFSVFLVNARATKCATLVLACVDVTIAKTHPLPIKL